MRFEYKYLLDKKNYYALRNALALLMDVDENSGKEGYHIRSIYFDDYKNKNYHLSLDGVEKREKHRIRFYNCEKDLIRFERKIKIGHRSQKKSFRINLDEMNSLLKNNWQPILNKGIDAEKIYVHQSMKVLQPKMLIAYDRYAYTLPYNQVRITFDLNVRYAKLHGNYFDEDLPLTPINPKYYYILEVKFNNFLPNFIKIALRNYIGHPISISKYVLSRQEMRRGY